MDKRKRLRKVSDAGARRIRELPNFGEVHRKVCAGISAYTIARWLQDDLGLLTDTAYDTLVRQLYRYRNSLPIEDRRTRQVAKLHQAVETQTHRVNTLEELNKLYEFQLQRLDKLIDLEGRLNQGVINTLGTEMDRAARYLNQIVSLKERLGLIKKGAPEVVQDNSVAVAAGAAGGAMAMLMSKYGDDAPDILSKVGQRLAEAVQRAGRAGTERPAGATNDTFRGSSQPLDPNGPVFVVEPPALPTGYQHEGMVPPAGNQPEPSTR